MCLGDCVLWFQNALSKHPRVSLLESWSSMCLRHSGTYKGCSHIGGPCVTDAVSLKEMNAILVVPQLLLAFPSWSFPSTHTLTTVSLCQLPWDAHQSGAIQYKGLILEPPKVWVKNNALDKVSSLICFIIVTWNELICFMSSFFRVIRIFVGKKMLSSTIHPTRKMRVYNINKSKWKRVGLISEKSEDGLSGIYSFNWPIYYWKWCRRPFGEREQNVE